MQRHEIVRTTIIECSCRCGWRTRYYGVPSAQQIQREHDEYAREMQDDLHEYYKLAFPPIKEVER